MMELAVAIAAGMMVLCVLVKGYTAKQITQLRQDAGRLLHEESRTRQELEQAEVLRESAEALNNQSSYDCQKFEEELTDLASQIASVEAQLGNSEAEDDA